MTTFTTEQYPHLIFAYGTLKRDYGNSRVFTGRGEFVASGVTEEKFVMTTGGFPRVYRPAPPLPEWVVSQAGYIIGDLWRANDEALEACDRIEGHPKWYRREEVDVWANGDIVKAWMYIMPAKGATGELMMPNENGLLEWESSRQAIEV